MKSRLFLALSLFVATVYSQEDDLKQCPPGRGGPSCKFGIDSIFWEHQPYDNFLPFKSELLGWSPKAEVYESICNRLTSFDIIIEVGVWKGLSASHLANCLRRRNSGVLFAVDTWLGALEFWDRRFTAGKYDSTRDLYLDHGYPSVYKHFLSNMVHAGVKDYVVPFPVTSRLAAQFFQSRSMQADIVHIDAAHEYHDVREDIILWWPLVKPCGILFGDDYIPVWSGVIRAVNEFVSENNLKLEKIGVKWLIRKPGC